MSDSALHSDIWQVWAYPDDPDWDGEEYDIGFITDSGSGTVVAQALNKDDAGFIIGAVTMYAGLLDENERLKAMLRAAGISYTETLQ